MHFKPFSEVQEGSSWRQTGSAVMRHPFVVVGVISGMVMGALEWIPKMDPVGRAGSEISLIPDEDLVFYDAPSGEWSAVTDRVSDSFVTQDQSVRLYLANPIASKVSFENFLKVTEDAVKVWNDALGQLSSEVRFEVRTQQVSSDLCQMRSGTHYPEGDYVLCLYGERSWEDHGFSGDSRVDGQAYRLFFRTPEGIPFVSGGTIVLKDTFEKVAADAQMRALRSVLVHEFGHVLGFSHPPKNEVSSVMSTGFPSDRGPSVLDSATLEGLSVLYGSPLEESL